MNNKFFHAIINILILGVFIIFYILKYDYITPRGRIFLGIIIVLQIIITILTLNLDNDQKKMDRKRK